MRVRTISSAIAALMILAACDALPTGPSSEPPVRALSASHAASRDVAPAVDTLPSCSGLTVAGINTLWPWAHDDKQGFSPPPGAIALWVQDLGPFIGAQSVRDVQRYFCSP